MTNLFTLLFSETISLTSLPTYIGYIIIITKIMNPMKKKSENCHYASDDSHNRYYHHPKNQMRFFMIDYLTCKVQNRAHISNWILHGLWPRLLSDLLSRKVSWLIQCPCVLFVLLMKLVFLMFLSWLFISFQIKLLKYKIESQNPGWIRTSWLSCSWIVGQDYISGKINICHLLFTLQQEDYEEMFQ